MFSIVMCTIYVLNINFKNFIIFPLSLMQHVVSCVIVAIKTIGNIMLVGICFSKNQDICTKKNINNCLFFIYILFLQLPLYVFLKNKLLSFILTQI